ncbi:MAG: hypothetical protein QGI68_14875 [Pseudomonadales bacterium]|jgi:nicotinate-nucleotide pyrophosphorylase (carboxylating)|nr:hypothetical protein [Pseudomonadales bacterium]MDP7357248.1 hypothetical protein [Pseudomonadales bacterium]MDP7596831.1 hypothetical protein [Pseudomonadales bacterium]HJN52796.1 hypothetical protein [Pseudomonadales bacterium]
MTLDIRDRIFEPLVGQHFRAMVLAAGDGVLAGISGAVTEAERAGCTARVLADDGDIVANGTEVLELTGLANGLATAEESVMGALGKPSGIATATRQLVDRAGPSLQIVAGGWKKMPRAVREMIRDAVQVGGAKARIEATPFLYLDKNYVRMFGGVAATLEAVQPMAGYRTVIQIGQYRQSLQEDTRAAVVGGVSTLFVDTGDISDLHGVIKTLEALNARQRVRLAFGGGVGPDEVKELAQLGVDALCIGRAIVDAPLVDFRMEIVERLIDERCAAVESTAGRK